MDVFEAGEVRPTRPKRKVIKVEANTKKRHFDASELEVRTPQSPVAQKRSRLVE